MSVEAEMSEDTEVESVILYARLALPTLGCLCSVLLLKPARLLIIKPCILGIFSDHGVEVIIFVDSTIVKVIILTVYEALL